MKLNNISRQMRMFTNTEGINKSILNNARKNKNIIYGARSIQKRIGMASRKTFDYDMFSNAPKKDANKLQKNLDRVVKFDNFYSKAGMHKGTWKVKSKGWDGIKDTRDDVGYVDFTETPKPQPKTDLINGIRYRKLQEEIAAKKKAIADKNFAFRHPKDKDDLNRIKLMTEIP